MQEANFVRSVIQNPGVHPFHFSSSVTIASSVSNVTLPKLRSITIFFSSWTVSDYLRFFSAAFGHRTSHQGKSDLIV